MVVQPLLWRCTTHESILSKDISLRQKSKILFTTISFQYIHILGKITLVVIPGTATQEHYPNIEVTAADFDDCIPEYNDGLEQDCSISIANTLEILQSCTKPSIKCTCTQSCSVLNKMIGYPLCSSNNDHQVVKPYYNEPVQKRYKSSNGVTFLLHKPSILYHLLTLILQQIKSLSPNRSYGRILNPSMDK